MHWSYDEVLALPLTVYDILLDQLNREGVRE
jgi:hypothetical protein